MLIFRVGASRKKIFGSCHFHVLFVCLAGIRSFNYYVLTK